MCRALLSKEFYSKIRSLVIYWTVLSVSFVSRRLNHCLVLNDAALTIAWHLIWSYSLHKHAGRWDGILTLRCFGESKTHSHRVFKCESRVTISGWMVEIVCGVTVCDVLTVEMHLIFFLNPNNFPKPYTDTVWTSWLITDLAQMYSASTAIHSVCWHRGGRRASDKDAFVEELHGALPNRLYDWFSIPPPRQIEPSGQLFPLPINLAAGPPTVSPLSSGVIQPAKFAGACHVDAADENRHMDCMGI